MSFPGFDLDALHFLVPSVTDKLRKVWSRASTEAAHGVPAIELVLEQQDITNYFQAFYARMSRDEIMRQIRNRRLDVTEAEHVVGAFDSVEMVITPLQHSYRMNDLAMALVIENELIRLYRLTGINSEPNVESFICAIQNGDFSVVWNQILYGIDVNRTIGGLTPLRHAINSFLSHAKDRPQVQANLVEIIRLFLVHGAVFDDGVLDLLMKNQIVDDNFLMQIKSVLHQVVSLRLKELLLFMLRSGLNLNGLDREGYTPLMRAAQSDWVDGVAILLSYGADVNIKTGDKVADTLAHGENRILLINMLRQARLDRVFN